MGRPPTKTTLRGHAALREIAAATAAREAAERRYRAALLAGNREGLTNTAMGEAAQTTGEGVRSYLKRNQTPHYPYDTPAELLHTGDVVGPDEALVFGVRDVGGGQVSVTFLADNGDRPSVVYPGEQLVRVHGNDLYERQD